MAVQADVSQAAAGRRPRRVPASVTSGNPGILINNAAIHVSGGILDVDEDGWDRLMATNLKGVYLCSRAVAPSMLAQGWGRIVNIAGVGGHHAVADARPQCREGCRCRSVTGDGVRLPRRAGSRSTRSAPDDTNRDDARARLADPGRSQLHPREESRRLLWRAGKDIAAGAVYLALRPPDS